MCFAPQRRAIFPDRDVQNGSEHEVFCTFWVENVLGATAACNFSTSNLQKVVRTRQFFNTFWLANVLRATAACHFSGSQLPKWLRPWGVLYILTHKCASRHSGVRVFPIATSKMAPTMRCFVHFDLQMCFAPQRRAAASTSLLFEHQEARIIEKTQRFATLLTFRVMGLLTWLLWYSCFLGLSCCATLLFCDLKTVPLCFSTLLFNCPYCRKLDL